MHRSRFYRNPNAPRFGYFNSASQIARSTYRRSSVTPFSTSYNRDPNSAGKHFAAKQPTYANPRFADRSKYVWTANKQQPQQSSPKQEPPSQPLQVVRKPTLPQTQTKTVLIKKAENNPNARELSALSVTVLDSAEAVAVDIAQKLNEEKIYLIKKVVDGLGVKKAIKLYNETRQKEANGGILVQNGIRRRTPGGVFLTLLRESSFISKQEANTVFLAIKRHEMKLKLTNSQDIS